MVFADMTDNNHNESRAVSEVSPLLQNSIPAAIDVPIAPATTSPHVVPRWLKRRIILLLCAVGFMLMLGGNLQPAALIQIFEDIICQDHYNKHPLPLATNNATAAPSSLALLPPPGDLCRAQAVQEELALVRGFHQLVPIFAGLLSAVPYGLLAERIGRKRVLVLSGAGVLASLSWVLAVCYWRFASIRWVWLSGAFLFIGGGDPVISSIIHVMVNDVTDRAERAQVFLYLHAVDVVSGFFGPAISGALMEKGYTWAVLLLAQVVLFSGTFLLTRCIPETLGLKDRFSGCPDPSSSGPKSPRVSVSSSRRSASPGPTKISPSIVAEMSSLLAPLRSVLASNRQALFLLCIFAPQSAARSLFEMVGLQYSRAKFSLSYSRGNVLLSLFQGSQGLFVLVILPLITHFIVRRRGWTAWTRDRLYAIVSIAVTASGLMVIAVAPALAIEAAGLLLVALGGCSTGFLMSLLGGTVQPSQVSAVYSAAQMLGTVVRSVLGPVANALLAKGLGLGWNWIGLPFAVVAVLMAGVAVASGFIRTEKGESFDED